MQHTRRKVSRATQLSLSDHKKTNLLYVSQLKLQQSAVHQYHLPLQFPAVKLPVLSQVIFNFCFHWYTLFYIQCKGTGFTYSGMLLLAE